MAKRVQTDKTKKMSGLKIYRQSSDVFRRPLSDRWESSPKRAIGKMRERVVRKSDRRLGCKECDWADWSIACHGCSFLCMWKL